MNLKEASHEPKASQNEAFAKRLEQAIGNHPNAPSGRGRQRWLRRQIAERFRMNISAEAVRKWFSGESRPRPTLMTQIAQVLNVSEAWLSLGAAVEVPSGEQRVRKDVADGAINVVAGFIQMEGGSVAFPESPEEGVDLYAIAEGRHFRILVKTAQTRDDEVRFTLPNFHQQSMIVGVIADEAKQLQLIRLPSELVRKHGKRRANHTEVVIKRVGSAFETNGDTWPRVFTIHSDLYPSI